MPKSNSFQPGKHFLQIPGPTNVPDRVLRAMDYPTIDHRGPEFAEIAKRVLDRIKLIFKTSEPVIIYPGSGTGAWEVGFRYEYLGIDDVKLTQSSTSHGAETRLRGAWDCGGSISDSYKGTGAGCDLDINQYTVGLKWIANPNVLAKVSLTYSDYGEDVKAPDFGTKTNTFDSETLLQTRIQWMF